MSLQDDIFDLEDYLKKSGTPKYAVEAFDSIVTSLHDFEELMDYYKEFYNSAVSLRKSIKLIEGGK